MGSADKSRKRSKEDKQVKDDGKKRKRVVDEVEEPSVDLKVKEERVSKKAKKEKKDKKNQESSTKVSKKEKKESKEKKSKTDKDSDKDQTTEKTTKDKKTKGEKEKDVKKEKKEKKEKEVKKDKKRKSEASSIDSDVASNSSAVSIPSSDTNADKDVEMTMASTTTDQGTTKTTVQKTKALKLQNDSASQSTTSTSDNDVDMTSNGVAEKKQKQKQAVVDTAQPAPKVDENGLTKKERRMLKIKKKQLNRKSVGDGEPSFEIKLGHDMLTLKDLRDLVVFILTETPSLPWIEVQNKFKIDKVLMLYVSGLNPSLFHINVKSRDAHTPIAWTDRVDKNDGPASEFDALKKYFEEMHVVQAPGDKFRIHSPTNTLMNVPLSISEKAKREREKKNNKPAKVRKPENYIMTLEELRENDFPIPRYLDSNAPELGEDWIETPKQPKATLMPPPKVMVAMDCEMCRTEAGPELTRVTLIDINGVAVLDELVMPERPILDYLTQYSGMTAARLEGVTTRLVDVQKKLQAVVDYDTILVGHSLENDMQVLKLAHPFIIDTSLIFHHTRGPPYRPGLKWLAQKWLHRQIQANVERGHDSAEDALACMDLAKLKLLKPPGFGEYVQDQESLFSRLARFNNPRTSALIDADSFAGQAATTTIKTMADEEVVEAIPEAIQKHNFVWARLRNIELYHGKLPEILLSEGQIADTGRASKVSSRDKVQATEEEVRQGIRSIDQSVKKIIESLPARTAVILTSGQGDHRELSKMQFRQKEYQELLKTKSWDQIPESERFLPEDVRKLEEEVEKTKNGVCFLMVKQ
ncbi:hypothetical protein BG011_002233 [Mortierella polycephala]|uniref:Exonuclease domain-containing protein n=1 Tax=Mortierella polycephala TaxID=41804 RepID=A0A9P6U5E9_9FUNG|nr:hypothetical protein BG011_002233 [Mortierella polycephala]